MFGVGGGFLISPACFFYRHPPSGGRGQRRREPIVASSFSALLVHLKTQERLICAWAASLLAASWSGLAAGVTIFNYLKSLARSICW